MLPAYPYSTKRAARKDTGPSSGLETDDRFEMLVRKKIVVPFGFSIERDRTCCNGAKYGSPPKFDLFPAQNRQAPHPA